MQPVCVYLKHEETAMEQNQMQGKFDELRGKLKETWGRLTDDDIALANGKMDQFLGKVQQTYGLTKEAAQERFDEIAKSFASGSDKPCCTGSDKSSPCGSSSDRAV
jgi:uncharacterized protein YjbJ (UPF0337 family)